MRIPKHPLHIWFDEVLAEIEIFKVKHNGYHSKYWLFFNFLLTLQKLSLVFNLNSCLLVMRNSKRTLIFEFYAALTEIFKVEDKAQFLKSQ